MGCGAGTAVSHPERSQELYKRGEFIGKGTYGMVYRCRSANEKMEFAMKVVRVGEGSKEKAEKEIQALKQEISLLKQLTHPNIVAYRTFQVAVAFDEVEIIMELVSGGTLKQYIDKNGSLTELETSRMCRHILQAMMYLHSRSIIHRDLKSANILLTECLVPKITDFGTAKLLPSFSNDDIANNSASLKGTPFYMAPELFKRTGHNQAADIWSFGCVALEMLSGKTPWTGISSNFSEIINYIRSGIHPPFPPNLTKQCQQFLEVCLDPIPAKRLSAADLLTHHFIERPHSKEKLLSNKTQREDKISTNRPQAQLVSQNELALKNIDDPPLILQNRFLTKKKSQKSEKDHKFGKKEDQAKKKQINRDNISLQIGDVQETAENQIQLENRYYVKKTLQNLKRRKKAEKNWKTTGWIKNGQQNILGEKYGEISGENNGRSNTQMGHEQEVINTMISRAERQRYIEEQKLFKKQREEQRHKWQQQLKEGSEMLKKEMSNRYTRLKH